MCSVSTSRSAPATAMPALLQRADDRLEQRAALAHQHQDVARRAPRAARRRRRRIARVDPALHRCARSAARAGRAGSSPASRRTARPSLRSRASRPARSSARARPGPARCARTASCTVAPGIVGQAGDAPAARLNTASTALEHDRRRAERVLKLHVARSAVRPASNALAKCALHLVELLRLRALEREDRLLLVADREDRARDLARARAGEELGRSAAGRSPIASGSCPAPRRSARGRCRGRACSAPRRRARSASRCERLVDQVVVVEQAAPVLLGAIALDHLVRDGDQRGGALARLDRAAARDQRARRAPARRAGAANSAGCRSRECALVTMFLRGSSSVGAEDRQIGLDALAAVARAQRVDSARACSLIVLRALLAARRDRRPFASPADQRAVEELRFDRCRRSRPARCRARATAPRSPPSTPPRVLDPRVELVALARSPRRPPRAKVWSAATDDRGRERAAERAVRLARRLRAARRCAAGRSARRCVRSSSTSKRAATSASNGNWCSSRVQNAWMVCTFSPPGVSSACANSRRARVRRCASRPAALDLARSPRRAPRRRARVHCAERLEHAVRHVGGGGLGEGEAEDFRRRRCRAAAAGSRAAPAHGSCPSRHWPRPRPRRAGSDAARCDVEHVGGNARRSFAHRPRPRRRPRPFLHAREMVVVAVARLPHRTAPASDRASLGRRTARRCPSAARARRRRAASGVPSLNSIGFSSPAGSPPAQRHVGELGDRAAGGDVLEAALRAGSRLRA